MSIERSELTDQEGGRACIVRGRGGGSASPLSRWVMARRLSPFEKHPEEPSYNLRFLLVNYDPPSARPVGRAVPTRGTAGCESTFGAAEHSVVRECAQPVEILGVHYTADLCSEIREFKARRGFVGRPLFGPQAIEQPAVVLHVAREPGEIETQEHVPLTNPVDQSQEPGSIVARSARDPRLHRDELLGHGPPARPGKLPASRDLVRRGRVGLLVRAHTRVDRAAYSGSSLRHSLPLTL